GGSAPPVAVEQPQAAIQPPPTPPVPTEAPLPPGAHQVPPHLLLHPVLDEAEAPARIPDRKVPDPAAQDRVDEGHHPSHGLRLKAPEDVPELLQQRRPLLQLGGVVGPPRALATAHPAELEAQEAEAFPFAQVHYPTLRLVDLDVELGQFLTQPLVHRPEQPVMSCEGVHQDDQVIGVARVLDVRVLAVASGLLGLLQHLVHLVEVEVTEQGGDHPALRDAFLPGRLQHHLEQVEHVAIAHPLRHLRQQQVMPHVVEVGPQIDIDDARLALDDGLGDPLHRLMGCPPWSVAKRPRLEVGLEDGFQDELECPLDHAIPDGGNAEDADLAAVLGYLLPPVPHRTIPVCGQFVLNLLEERLDAARLDGLEGDPVDTRSPVVLLGQQVGLAEGFQLANVNVQAPEAPGRVGLRLGVDLPPQVLQLDGRLYHPAPASRVVGRV